MARQQPGRRASRPLGLLLLPIGCFGAAVGFADAFGAALLEYRLIGALLLLCGGVVTAGALALLIGSPRGRALALIGAALAPLIGLNMTLAQLGGREYDARLALWLLMLIGPAPVAFVLWNEGVRTRIPRQLVGALSAGLLLSMLQFWYTAQYVPSSVAPSLTVTVGLIRVGQDQYFDALAATISVKNVSGTRVRVLGSMYRIAAVRKCFTNELSQLSDERGFTAELANAAADNRPASRVAQDRSAEVLMADKFVLVPEGGWFEPGEEVSRQFMTWIPRFQRYDLVRMETSFAFAKGNQLDIDTYHGVAAEPQRGVQAGDQFIEQAWPIRSLSLLARLTRDPLNVGNLVIGRQRILVTRWFIGGDGSGAVEYPFLRVYLDSERRTSANPPFDDYNVELADLYGLAVASSSTEVTLWPATSPTLANSTAVGRLGTENPIRNASPIGRGFGCPDPPPTVSAGSALLDGRVSDEDGHAIEDALIRMAPIGIETRTNIDGHYRLGPIAVPNRCRWVTIEISRAGWGKLTVVDAALPPGVSPANYVLRPVEQQVYEGPPAIGQARDYCDR
jgi:hypothetical protein